MRLPTPQSVGKLQQALHEKAKESPSFRFYSLYDKIYRPDVLRYAYRLQKANKGVPGVNGEAFDEVEEYGLEKWLEMPVEETDDAGNIHRSTKARDERVGSPQGAPISPLLANIYMRRFMVAWEVLGWRKKLQAHIVNYADDFVICSRGSAEGAMEVMRGIMRKLKLTVNEKKTCLRRLPEESFTFLGYWIGRCYSPRTGEAYIGTRPMKEKVQGLCREVSEATSSALTHLAAGEIVEKLNAKFRGWANYFDLGQVSKAYRALEQHACRRLRQWLARKHKVTRGAARSRWPREVIHGRLSLVDITKHRRAYRGRNS